MVLFQRMARVQVMIDHRMDYPHFLYSFMHTRLNLGIAMAVCIISLLSGKAVPRTTAMTGEITLRGQVRPVGGIKEKVLSAHRAGVTKVILPAVNERDMVQDVPDKVKQALAVVYCRTMWEVLDAAFEEKLIHDSEAFHCQAGQSSRLWTFSFMLSWYATTVYPPFPLFNISALLQTWHIVLKLLTFSIKSYALSLSLSCLGTLWYCTFEKGRTVKSPSNEIEVLYRLELR